MIKFFKDTWREMKLVTWPTGKQWRKDVLVVVEMTIIFALFFALADVVFGQLVRLFLK